MNVAASGSVGALATLAVNAAGGGWIVLPSAGWGLVWGAAVYLVAMDLGEYLFHRAQHAIPALWAMHTLHHSDGALGATPPCCISGWTADQDPHHLAGGRPPIQGLALVVAIYAAASYYNFWTHANVRIGYGRASWAAELAPISPHAPLGPARAFRLQLRGPCCRSSTCSPAPTASPVPTNTRHRLGRRPAPPRSRPGGDLAAARAAGGGGGLGMIADIAFACSMIRVKEWTGPGRWSSIGGKSSSAGSGSNSAKDRQ